MLDCSKHEGRLMASAFNVYIKARRIERGLSIREAAARMKVSPSRLGELERGKTYARDRDTRPGRDLIARMAAAYDLPEAVLLVEAGYPAERPPEFSPEIQQAIALINMLTPDGRKLALGLLRLLVEQGR
ncbi:helix-turn-helix protein [compost metagenome]